MDKKQKKYLIIGLEVVLLVLLLVIVVIASTTIVDNNNEVSTVDFNHSANITGTNLEKLNIESANYTLETISYSDGFSQEKLYLTSNNKTTLVSNTLIDNHNIVVGIL